jgi:hypothetical protein
VLLFGSIAAVCAQVQFFRAWFCRLDFGPAHKSRSPDLFVGFTRASIGLLFLLSDSLSRTSLR